MLLWRLQSTGICINYFIFQKVSIHLFLAVLGFVASHRLSLAAASGLCCHVRASQHCRLSELLSPGSRHAGCSSWGTQAQPLQLEGLVAPRHVKSSWTRDQTHVPLYWQGWILIHCATRVALIPFISNLKDFLGNSSSRVC